MNAISRPRVFPGLVKLVIRGYEGKPEYPDQVDAPGSANWLLDTYGVMPYEGWQGDERAFGGVIWSDYDLGADDPWAFSVIVPGDESKLFRKRARRHGYTVVSAEVIFEPQTYGDGHRGTVAICEHPEGWVVLPS